MNSFKTEGKSIDSELSHYASTGFFLLTQFKSLKVLILFSFRSSFAKDVIYTYSQSGASAFNFAY